MASESFEDRIRRASGQPTAAQLAATAAAEEAEKRRLADDQPRRNALKAAFEAKVAPLIVRVRAATLTTLATSKTLTLEADESRFNHSSGLAEANIEAKKKPTQAREPFYRFYPLCFSMQLDGRVRVSTVSMSGTPAFIPIDVEEQLYSVDELTLEKIQEVVVSYVAKAHELTRERTR